MAIELLMKAAKKGGKCSTAIRMARKEPPQNREIKIKYKMCLGFDMGRLLH